MHLYETHLPVRNTKIAENFYGEIVGLPFAYRDPTRDIVFLSVDENEKAMLGLWKRTSRTETARRSIISRSLPK
jgi:hypothetical protein